MERFERFDLKLPRAQRRAVDEFAQELGLTSSSVIRLAIARLIVAHDDVLSSSIEGAS
jgi:hypothetical protein